MEHPAPEVNQALIRLNDALCTWERTTGLQSVLILQEQGGFEHQSISGKPCNLESAFPVVIFRLCEHCNKEYRVPLVAILHESIYNFGPCPHCGERDDVWVRVILRTAEYESSLQLEKTEARP